MNIQQLRYVIAVANSGSFREASKKLFITQPSLSNGIKELEAEVKISLFTRTNRGAYLTEEGKEFLAGAEKIIEQMELFENRYHNQEVSDTFSIASQHYDFLGTLVAELLAETSASIKKFRIHETTTGTVIEDVRNFYSEIGLIYLNEHNRAGIKRYLEQAELDYFAVGDFQTHIFLGKQHPLAEQKEIHLAELVGYPQVRFTQDGSNFPYFAEDLVEIPEQEQVIYTSDRGTLVNILTATEAYASGSGLVIGPAKEVIRLIPLAESPSNTFYIIHSRKRPLSPVAQQFIKKFQQIIK